MFYVAYLPRVYLLLNLDMFIYLILVIMLFYNNVYECVFLHVSLSLSPSFSHEYIHSLTLADIRSHSLTLAHINSHSVTFAPILFLFVGVRECACVCACVRARARAHVRYMNLKASTAAGRNIVPVEPSHPSV
jgi:hypothetical protein